MTASCMYDRALVARRATILSSSASVTSEGHPRDARDVRSHEVREEFEYHRILHETLVVLVYQSTIFGRTTWSRECRLQGGQRSREFQCSHAGVPTHTRVARRETRFSMELFRSADPPLSPLELVPTFMIACELTPPGATPSATLTFCGETFIHSERQLVHQVEKDGEQIPGELGPYDLGMPWIAGHIPRDRIICLKQLAACQPIVIGDAKRANLAGAPPSYSRPGKVHSPVAARRPVLLLGWTRRRPTGQA